MVDFDYVFAEGLLHDFVNWDGFAMVSELQVVEYELFGFDVAEELVSGVFVEEDEGVLELGDFHNELRGDELGFFQHEHLIEGGHDFFEGFVLVVHHVVYELDLQLVQVVLLSINQYLSLVVDEGQEVPTQDSFLMVSAQQSVQSPRHRVAQRPEDFNHH